MAYIQINIILCLIKMRIIYFFRRLRAIKSILKPTERKMWIKTNLILMLIWYGSGFSFRYVRPPHIKNKHVSTQGALEEIVFSNMGSGYSFITFLY